MQQKMGFGNVHSKVQNALSDIQEKLDSIK